MRESDFAYSFGVSFGCSQQHSPNFCLGYLLSFDKVFLGRPANSPQIWQVANKTGWNDGGQNTTASPDHPCTVNAIFCVPFTKAYDASYEYHITYWEGVKAGNKYADHVIDTCTLTKYPNFIFLNHRSVEYKASCTAIRNMWRQRLIISELMGQKTASNKIVHSLRGRMGH